MNKSARPMNWLALPLLAAAGLKAALAAGGAVPFNADEAVVALMARHILGGARPAFFYGQAYMGSLDAWLAAAGFALFGQQVWVIRLVQGLLYLGTILTTYWLGKEAFGDRRVGLAATWLLAIPVVNVTLYTTASLGGYGEALLIGNALLLLALRMGRRSQPVEGWSWLAFGFLAGLGVWVFGLTLVYALPALLYVAWRFFQRRTAPAFNSIAPAHPSPLTPSILLSLTGLVVGSAPWWFYALQNGAGALVGELRGGAVAGVEGLSWAGQVLQHAASLLLLGSTAALGFRPPWEVRWLALPLAPLALAFWLAVLVFSVRSFRGGQPRRAERGLVLGVALTLAAAFIFTPFGADPSGRYFVPLAAPLALFAGQALAAARDRFGGWAWAALALLLAFNAWGTWQCASRIPPGITTQFDAVTWVDERYSGELVQFLTEQGETRGYTNYWVSYPLAFRSGESLIFTPRLPYHEDFRYTRRDNRYAPYNELVEAAEQVAYITTHHTALDERLRSGFTALGVGWQERQIGDYHVFYALSRVVRPEELGMD